ncbi:LPO_1073/Vpar_1526 family protein [Vibrio splendidus]|uniref:LPO_1073/Vpar_1526 family protein n=1 Tax=Vibrio splendidus TaxID=29497 RepID=UPI000D38CAB4|nr:LPO_1073/Vpar_1526 family protein [Vibrio splendidus]PTO99629.1 hypothetical protein CWN88_17065 [Vibrio splendidus]PTP94135.1 hypothetical protein CWO28_23970 [Vibrio splendidus]
MINDNVHKQQGGDSSNNFQGQSLVINQGISYSDARDIALDVYKSNFIQLSEDAAKLAKHRAEELTDNFLETLKETNQAAISEMKQPSMQAALYEAQKQYAKSGDKELESMLVDILVQRASTSERNTKQIVLDEALEVVSKLTNDQLNILSINFAIARLNKPKINNTASLIDHIQNELSVFIDPEVEYDQSWFEHLAYSGCVTFMDASSYKVIPELFLNQYPAVFQKGFDEKEFEDFVGKKISDFKVLLMGSFHTVNLFQFNQMNEQLMTSKIKELKMDEHTGEKLIQFFNTKLMNHNEVKEWMLENVPNVETLLKRWDGDNNQLSKIQLTTVGVALAQANYKKKVKGIEFDLAHWVK